MYDVSFIEFSTENVGAVALLKAKLPEDMFILPTDIDVSVVIGQGTA